jgi:hypothetical protein
VPFDGSAQEAADYIAQMTGELADIATAAQLEMLAYFLKMAQMEAANIQSHLVNKADPV